MDGHRTSEDLSLVSSWELASTWINGDPGSNPGLKASLEAEFGARGLPLPVLGPQPQGPARSGKPPMSREAFLDYLLLIYTVTGIFYAWLFLPIRLIRGDFDKDRKHHLIQLAIALGYQGAEIGAYFLINGLLPQ